MERQVSFGTKNGDFIRTGPNEVAVFAMELVSLAVIIEPARPEGVAKLGNPHASRPGEVAQRVEEHSIDDDASAHCSYIDYSNSTAPDECLLRRHRVETKLEDGDKGGSGESNVCRHLKRMFSPHEM